MRRLLFFVFFALLSLLSVQLVGAQEAAPKPLDGTARCINLAALEFGETVPGTYDKTYTSPVKSLKYYASIGFTHVRLPILMARFSARGYTGSIDDFLDEAQRLGVGVIIDMRSNEVRDGKGITAEELSTAWTTLLSYVNSDGVKLADHPALAGVGLLNEPNGFDDEWATIAQSTIDVLDELIPVSTPIMASGREYGTASQWERTSTDLEFARKSNGVVRYEFHQYADSQGWGDESDKTLPATTLLSGRIEPVLSWLQETGNFGFWGEAGVRQDDPAWFATLDPALSNAQAANVPVCLWAGGPWWGDYPLSLEPKNGRNAPLIDHLIETGWLVPISKNKTN